MLNTVSWHEFLTVVSLLIGGYYLTTGLLFYQHEIKTLFTQKSKTKIDFNTPNHKRDEHEVKLMGAARYDNHPVSSKEISIDAEDLVVHTDVRETKNADESHPEIQLIGTIADLIQEIKMLLTIISQNPKKESIPMLQSLLSRYPQLKDTQYQEAINLFLYTQAKEQCELDLTLHEINSWWPMSPIKINN